ncbi:universal stress protein [Oceanicoccus sp. KOV_DT_Chl]|uniref:universal stress protein n=1 Tax=Oceanicoccus sp. KOV_DT_Chl TaxID=1904639 RepID=UPI000C7CF195|nr:universal stress protein [Oceanicoccus sp. KOV_DT_Chl]
MSIKRILVNLDNNSTFNHRLEWAITLAKSFDAEIDCLYIEPAPLANTVYPQSIALGMPVFPDRNLAAHKNRVENDIEEISNKIKKISAIFNIDLSLTSIEKNWQTAIPEYSRYYDLIIMGKEIDGENALDILGSPTSNIVIKSSCPVLILPEQPRLTASFNHPIIAWNASREAGRAVSDSLPFIQLADDVTVFNGSHQLQGDIIDNESSKSSILRYLKQHEVDADYVECDENADKIGDMLLARVEEYNHDFMVVGAGRHSKFYEMLFNNTVEDVLDKTDIPVLVSH